MSPTFYVGSNKLNWLHSKPNRHPLFISIRTINRMVKMPPANIEWCCDSGGFTELTLYDKWLTTPEQYVTALERANTMGKLQWASPQDYMCEPHMLEKTGMTVEQHQYLTCENYLELQALKPSVRIIPVLQGWHPDDYRRHVDMYLSYGVDLRHVETVGMGSFCRRANVSGVRELVIDLYKYGLKMHGFGLKRDGLRLFGDYLQSSDSMAWSLAGRIAGLKGINLCGAVHNAKGCGSCHPWAMMWADQVAKTEQTAAPLLWEAI